VLLHLVDGTGEDPAEAYRIVRGELQAYGNGLADKPEIVALTKVDALTPDAIKAQLAKLKKVTKKTPLVLSSQSGEGKQETLRALWSFIAAAREDAEPKTVEQVWQP
jgi:GTP-binding protein